MISTSCFAITLLSQPLIQTSFPTYNFQNEEKTSYKVKASIEGSPITFGGTLWFKTSGKRANGDWWMDISYSYEAFENEKLAQSKTQVSNFLVDKNLGPKAIGAGELILSEQFFYSVMLPTSASFSETKGGKVFKREATAKTDGHLILISTKISSEVQNGTVEQTFDTKTGKVIKAVTILKTGNNKISYELTLVP